MWILWLEGQDWLLRSVCVNCKYDSLEYVILIKWVKPMIGNKL
jgi:hypothetical protein